MHTYKEAIQEKQMKVRRIYKWVVLISYCSNVMANIFLFAACAPIWSYMAIYYDTTDYNLNFLINFYYIGPITTTFLFNPLIIKHYGVSQILSCIFTTLGLWLLVIVGRNYYLGLVAFCFLGVGESIITQVPLYLSKLWFDPKDRIFSTFIAQYSGNIGTLIGYTFSAFYFIDDGQQLFNQKYENMITLNAIFASIALVANFLTLKEPHDDKDKIEAGETITNSLFKIVKTQEGFYDLASVSSFIGLGWCYTMLFGTQQFFIGQTYLDVITISMMFFVGQIIAGGAYTWKLQQQSNSGIQLQYDKYIKISMIIGYWSLMFEMMFFEDLLISFLAFLNFFVGAGVGGQYSILLESLMEKHFPIQELAIGSLLTAVANVCLNLSKAEALIMVIITIFPKVFQYGFQISCYLMIPSYCYITVFYKTQFKRFELEA